MMIDEKCCGLDGVRLVPVRLYAVLVGFGTKLRKICRSIIILCGVRCDGGGRPVFHGEAPSFARFMQEARIRAP